MSLRGSRIGDARHFLLGGADGYGGVDNSIRLHPHIIGSSSSRAVETDLAKFGSFKVTAFQNGLANYMEDVTYTKTAGEWITDEGNFRAGYLRQGYADSGGVLYLW